MLKRLAILGGCVALSGCGDMIASPQSAPAGSEGTTRPQSRPAALTTSDRRPPATARTAEAFDTSTAAEKEAAAAGGDEAAAARALGTTIVSLGDPARPGFWIETPQVSTAGPGRVVFPDTGRSAQVELLPVDRSGSRLSLAAMRLLGLPLTGLTEVQVFVEG